MENENVILLTTGCPKCKVLKKKLEDKNINYTENNDVEYMKTLGMMSAPGLLVNNKLLNFNEAISYVNNYS